MDDYHPSAELGGTEHHPLFSPSSSERWLNCTASPMPIKAMAEVASEHVNVHMANGTLAHAVLEDALRHGGKNTPRFEVGTSHLVDGYAEPLTVTSEMASAVEWALDIIYSTGAGVLQAETRVGFPVEWADGTELVEGTSDVMLQTDQDPTVLHVMDFKYGRGVRVRAKENTQMMCYGLGGVHSLGFLFEGIETVRLHVLQPRLDHHDHWDIRVSSLWDWAGEDVSTAVNEVLTATGQFRPSEDACRWCPIGAAGECKAQVEAVLADFDVVPATAESPLDAVNVLHENQLADLLPHLRWLERVSKALIVRATTLAQQDLLPGYKTVEGRSPGRRWVGFGDGPIMETAIGAACIEAFGENYNPFTAPELKSPAAIEKEVGKKQFAAAPAVQASIIKPRGGVVLAPVDDPRPKWDGQDGDPTEDFDVLD